ncbi:MAG: DUF4363 family protein [Clostridiales bacterium]|nr:DUF4363 family protein [Clostridiales bacterium]
MRRLSISVAILLLLFGAGLWNISLLEGISGRLASQLEHAEALAETGDWDRAEELTLAAKDEWEAAASYLYVVLRHDYTDEVNTGFYEVLELLQWQETPEYAAANGELVAQVQHLSEAERLTWRNLM